MEWDSVSDGGGRGDEEEEEEVQTIDSLGGGSGFTVAMDAVRSVCGMEVSDAPRHLRQPRVRDLHRLLRRGGAREELVSPPFNLPAPASIDYIP